MQSIEDAGRFSAAPDGGPHWVEQLRVPDLSVGTYSIPVGGTDGQDPHTEDEIYVITAGRAALICESPEGETISLPVGPGSVVYVAAGEVHRFVDITEDLSALVLFAPAEESRAGLSSGGGR